MRGEWIEISYRISYTHTYISLSPCGESGLKYNTTLSIAANQNRSLPMRGEWIEIVWTVAVIFP